VRHARARVRTACTPYRRRVPRQHSVLQQHSLSSDTNKSASSWRDTDWARSAQTLSPPPPLPAPIPSTWMASGGSAATAPRLTAPTARVVWPRRVLLRIARVDGLVPSSTAHYIYASVPWWCSHWRWRVSLLSSVQLCPEGAEIKAPRASAGHTPFPNHSPTLKTPPCARWAMDKRPHSSS
jgi:hypothetical protein